MSTAEDLGERKIIEIILDCLERMPNMPIPFGDDVSALDIGDHRLAVLKTDMLVGKTDVPLGMSLWQVARKAVVMNISDLAAKGVEPKAVLVSLGIPGGYSREDIQQIGRGLNAGAREYHVYVLGGDTNQASDLVISCSLLGSCDRGHIMERSGAKPGNLVAVTGFFGKTASGLKILLDNRSAPPNLRKELTRAVLMPHARLKEGLALAETGAVRASIDSSDGLAWSLNEIAEASGVGLVVDNPPVAPEARRFAEAQNLNPLELCLYGGEEYELVLTIEEESWEEAREAVEQVEGSLIRIGRVVEGRRLLLKSGEETTAIEARGWEHFREPG
ncbi:thiamine-phosphate kinase [Candidatus Bathyarchaeota archaeon]|nr:thiamine-phosphate kinase [Candidatus Bathyarchaeota archaeon]NIR17558.1 thiamine-phosphate kinase [Desulfobacterales bacterium]NIU81247.1 thiamine-phosphate kinase [Candidatus Bathyarchaeota archaeon]NIV67897.1 thiamine-phosphate kinase [Candidatus Bathyarchaeota archaeon]NIW16341.1 thiamine-phosphate kinase [Candidatus Bathyarchaeota archaeon]